MAFHIRVILVDRQLLHKREESVVDHFGRIHRGEVFEQETIYGGRIHVGELSPSRGLRVLAQHFKK